MATPQYLPKARRVWKRGRCPRPKEGGTATVSFSEPPPEMAHSGVLDARNTPPFSSLWAFSYRSLGIRPGKHSVWCQGVSGVVIPRFASGSPFTADRDYPVPRPCARRVPGSPFSPRHAPILEGSFPPLSQRPLRGGGIMANFRSRENGRD